MRFEKYLPLFLFCCILSSCATRYDLQNEPPVEIGDVYFQKTVGGLEETPTKYEIFIPVTAGNPDFEEIYFRNQKTILTKENPNLWSAAFIVMEDPIDMVMSANSSDEYGNLAEKKKEMFPFELKENEIVVGYKEDDKMKFFKIENLEEKKAVYLPQRNRENN